MAAARFGSPRLTQLHPNALAIESVVESFGSWSESAKNQNNELGLILIWDAYAPGVTCTNRHHPPRLSNTFSGCF